jgi:hypothetical protein
VISDYDIWNFSVFNIISINRKLSNILFLLFISSTTGGPQLVVCMKKCVHNKKIRGKEDPLSSPASPALNQVVAVITSLL